MIYDFDYNKITSSHFWDMMDYVDDQSLQDIEEVLTKNIIKTFDLDLDLLLYDYTNFFTFIDTKNNRNNIAQRGKNKQKRNDLRQFCLALLVTRDCRIPIFSDIYEGNKADAKEFSSTIDNISKRLNVLSKGIEDLTIVFDKGSNSKDNFDRIGDMNFVASFSVYHDKELEKVPFTKFEDLAMKGSEIEGKKDSALM